MDEFNVMALIAEGETTGKVDYKRELHLENAENKAEFIKDVISLANSAPGNKGYLLIGVNDDRYVVGCDELEEERIQQIVHRYIRPSVILRCYMVPMHIPGCPSVGVIEIEGLERPHRVVQDIARLKQDRVFVRHGSVIGEASPEEIRWMQNETEERRKGLRLIEAAKTHLDLDNFEDAIDVYTQAIRVMPTAALFLDRGKAYRRFIESEKNTRNVKELAAQALKDLSDAIHLTSSDEVEKESRLERLRVFSLAFVEYEEWKKEIEWLKENTEGRQLGEVIYLDYKREDDLSGISNMEPEVLAAMNTAIELGYGEPEVYDLRSLASFYLFNYGLALQDINEAIKHTENVEERIDRLAFRATIQVRMRRFKEAHDSLLGAYQLSLQLPGKKFHGPRDEDIASGIEEEILWRYGLESKFGQIEPYPASAVISVLIAHMVATRQLLIPSRFEDGKVVEPLRKLTGKSLIRWQFSPIIRSIREIVGEDFWEQCEYIGHHGTLVWKIKENE